ncbi:MAG TPA: trehalose-6-phosphate synthase, partial [Burkholderiaceae bacterium]|nr:trehalose-6-phosphate synthase [Burkholderiaceae bacterium]
YTKGILERFAAVERLLEMEPGWVGRLCFLQIAAPSRSSIDEYQSLDARVRAAATRINARFASAGCPPIILRIEHHDAERVYTLYRAADFCFVSSLHDGMNLVAKEFVAARDDERGVLILSQFTGAARELSEALIVNPYDTEQSAAALRVALSMPPDEQRHRMRSMRSLIQEFNVYRWAGRMLLDAAQVYELYRGADLCCVSSLHDGMNLVAKEFVAARDDQQGVLILSQFTGAARELVDALIVNPYDIEQSAAALHLALTMPPAEQRARMRSMRSLVQDFNVYRWAGRMLLDAARMRNRRRVLARARAARREAGAA